MIQMKIKKIHDGKTSASITQFGTNNLKTGIRSLSNGGSSELGTFTIYILDMVISVLKLEIESSTEFIKQLNQFNSIQV